MHRQIATMIASFLLAIPAAADDHRGFSAGGGIGVAESEFMTSFEAPHSFDDHWSFGPVLQLAFEEDVILVMASANTRYRWGIDRLLDDTSNWAKRTDVFLQAGLGVSHIDVEVDLGPFGSFDADDTAFLINFGFGGEYELNDRLALTSHMLFNIHAGDLFDDGFSFSWQLLGARYRF